MGYIWSRIKDPHRELDYVPEPENKLIRFFFNTSTRVSSSWIWRTILYLSISLLISAFAIIDVVSEHKSLRIVYCNLCSYYDVSVGMYG